MINKARTGWLRLAMGGAQNIALWPIFMGLAKWSNLEREFNLNLVGGSVAGDLGRRPSGLLEGNS